MSQEVIMYYLDHRNPQPGTGPIGVRGESVKYVVCANDVEQIHHVIPQANSVTEGEVLPAMIVRSWGPGMVNLLVFIDGPRPYWTTSVSYYLPTLVNGIDAATPVYGVSPRSWHYASDVSPGPQALAFEQFTIDCDTGALTSEDTIRGQKR